MTENLPPTKPASDLQPGDHILIEDLGDEDAEGVGEVLHVKVFGPGDRRKASVLINVGDVYQPERYCVQPDAVVRLASDAEVAKVREHAARLKVSEDLRELASLIYSGAAPVQRGGMHIVEQLGDVAALAAVAHELGIEVEEGVGGYRSVDWPKGHDSADRGLHVTWIAYAEKRPKAKPVDDGLSYSREPESTVVVPVPAGVDGHPEGGRVPELAYIAPTPDGGMVFALKGVDEFDEQARRAALELAHAEALADDNDRAKWAVIRGLRAGEAGRVHNPNLARFLAGKEYKRREAAKHFPRPVTQACVLVGDPGFCTVHELSHQPISKAECGCPVYAFASVRGDSADTIVDHRPSSCTDPTDA